MADLPESPPSAPRAAALLVLAAVLVLLAAPAIRPFLPVDETRYLSVAWEMRLSGDPFHLTMNGAPYSHKPPLLFWLINLVWSMTGPTDYAARLVGPMSAIAAIGMTGLLARRIAPEEKGLPLAAMAVLGATTGFLFYGGATMFDALLTVWVLLGIGAIWRLGQGQRGLGPWLILGLALGFGALTKGPVILLHVMPVLLAIRLWAPSPPGWRAAIRGLGVALLLALALVGIWLVPLLIEAPGPFLREILWEQSAERVAGTMGHGRPVWFLLAALPALIFPFGWSVAVWRGLPGAVRADAAGRMLAIWALAALVLFSLVGGKQLHYLLPELPAFAILAARALPAGRSVLLAFALPALLALAAVAAAAGLIVQPGMEEAARPVWLMLLAAAAFAGLAVAAFRLPLLPGAGIAGIGVAAVATVTLALSGFGDRLDARPIGARLKAAEAGGLAIWKNDYQAEFNFAGRLTVPLVRLRNAEELAAWAAAHPEGTLLSWMDRAPVAAAPAAVLAFEDRLWGLWPAAAVTSPAPAPGG